MTIDSACSSSLVGVDVACRYLDSYQADGMLVAGANLWLSPEHNEEIGMMNKTQSASGKCHSFDSKADGYVKAEGMNIVLLKRLDDAIRDGDPIRAIIRGTATNSDGRTPGIASPSAEAQAAAIRAAYANAGITNLNETAYLECHGTGTPAGDPMEVKGASSVFAATRIPGQDLVIGSIKSNIGHSEAAAGLSGLIKAVLSVERGQIPGNPTFITPNPDIDFAGSRVRVTRTPIKWPATYQVRRASVNSFGFGGSNAHAIVENSLVSQHVSSYKQITSSFFDDDEDDSAKPYVKPTILAFSANDQDSLKNNIKALSGHLINPGVSVDISDLAYTLSEKRSRHYYRAFTVTNSSHIEQDSLVFGQKAISAPKIGFVFTGQGAQWSQMGLDLVDTFPQAKAIIQKLDEVLQKLPNPPKWKLLEELTEARSSEALRQPEFSQPLVTALQLAIVEILKGWGIAPQAVIGHSSGEIAAAAAAGLVDIEEAIKTAYYRGQAAKQLPPKEPLGMLAVGISSELIQSYLDQSDDKIQIACYNSPSSLTMSGTATSLEMLQERLKKDGHFARMLLVDLAYHSHYMTHIGELYEEMLLKNSNMPPKKSEVSMFSSVTGELLSVGPDAAYWKSNMVSPVRFTQAATQLLQHARGADFLIEIGPSNALSGPIAQIKKSLSGASAGAQYTSTLKRGPNSTHFMYSVAGQLYLSGGSVNLRKVNRLHESKTKPKVIVDLPNYAWNHTQKYWHETQASKDWRFKKFINHDLLGSKMNGTAWQSPIFSKILKLGDMPWLRDHQLGTQVIFPGAGYCAMAIEAMYQTAMVTQWNETEPTRYRYKLRDVKFSRALVLEEDIETRYSLTLTPLRGGSTRTWYEFKVCSSRDTVYTEHCSGAVCVETDYKDEFAPREAMNPLELATPASVIYKAARDSGYNYGPCFQQHLMHEATMGVTESRSTVSLVPPPSAYDQSYYPVHPSTIDACFYIGILSVWKGDIPTVGTVNVPSILSSLTITGGRKELPYEGIALASADFMGIGREDLHRNYGTNCSLYDPKDGTLLFEMKGLTTRDIETSEEEGPRHLFTHVAWEADVQALLSTSESNSKLKEYIIENDKTTQDLIDLVAHKIPTLKVLEINLEPKDTSSLWVQEETNPIRVASSQYHFTVSDPTTLVTVQKEVSPHVSNAQFSLLELSQATAVVADVQFDLAIVKAPEASNTYDQDVVKQILAKSVRSGGFILVVGEDLNLVELGTTQSIERNIDICLVQSENVPGTQNTISYVSLLGTSQVTSEEILKDVRERGWNVEECIDTEKDVKTEQPILILDELSEPLMDRLDARQWQMIKSLIQKRCKILWVTSGGHIDVTNPAAAAISGFFRTIRAEENLNLITLDVEKPAGEATVASIISCLELLCQPESDDRSDYEFVERGGVVKIGRLIPDWDLTNLQGYHPSERKTDVLDLHAHENVIQLGAERLGNVDSIHYHEISPEPVPLPDGYVEVEVYATGLNYKDVVVTMGIVPGDERELGGEAAGIVTKTSPSVTSLAIGDRVVVSASGTIANRVRTRPGRIHKLPDWMSFEEAATLCGVYLTSIYSLFDMANLTAGKKLLIHSAAGGVGIAAMQLAQYAGAEVSYILFLNLLCYS